MNHALSIALTGVATCAVLAAAPAADAAVLMLDFGPTVATGGSLTNSPYHTATPGFTGAVWNTLGTADVAAGLLYADNTAATGVAVNLGAVTNATTINLATQPSSSNALGLATNTGVYDGNSVGKDGIFHGTGGQTTKLGVQITGLAAGTYDVFLTARNTNTGTGQPADNQAGYVSVGAAGNFDVAALTPETLTFTTGSTTVATAAWVEDSNYLRFTVTLAEGQALNIASGPAGARGFLNSLQIALVPEPASMALLGAGVVATLARRRR